MMEDHYTANEMILAMLIAFVVVGIWAFLIWVAMIPVKVNGYPMKVWEAVALTPVFLLTFLALGVLIVCTETVNLVRGRAR